MSNGLNIGLITMATDRRAITSYLPDDIENKLLGYCTEYGITRKDKDGNVVPSMGTGIVEILKVFFNQDTIPSPFPNRSSFDSVNLTEVQDNLKRYFTEYIESKLPESINGILPNTVSGYIDSKLPSTISEYIDNIVPKNLTENLDNLTQQLESLTSEVACLKKPHPLLIR